MNAYMHAHLNVLCIHLACSWFIAFPVRDEKQICRECYSKARRSYKGIDFFMQIGITREQRKACATSKSAWQPDHRMTFTLQNFFLAPLIQGYA